MSSAAAAGVEHGYAIAAPSLSGWLVDGHVHLHECFDADTFFTAAANNFANAAEHARPSVQTHGCLLLVDTARQNRFRDLLEDGLGSAREWTIRPTAERTSVWAESASRSRVAVIAGRQIATAEGLEVLGVGDDALVPDGLPIRDVLRTVADRGAIPIVPWGFGKWWFRRGALVGGLITDPMLPPFLLGDNGGRAQRHPTPPLFRRAAANGIWNVPGSDPLPLDWQVDRVGSYGFHIVCEPDLERPAAQLLERLRSATAQPTLFGARETWPRFVRAQIGIRTQTGRALPMATPR